MHTTRDETMDFGDEGWMSDGWMDPMPQGHCDDSEGRRMRDDRVSAGLNAHVKVQPAMTTTFIHVPSDALCGCEGCRNERLRARQDSTAKQISRMSGPVEVKSKAQLDALLTPPPSTALVKTTPNSPFTGPDDEWNGTDMGKNRHRHHQQTSQPQVREVAVFDDKGECCGTETGKVHDYCYNWLKEAFGECQLVDDGPWVLACPLEFYRETKRLTTKNFTPGPCLFDSTSNYLKAILGRQLHDTDKQFFNDHPLTEEHGSPMFFTARIAQEVIAPYGLRVSRIRINVGHPVEYDLRDWMMYLGCNPMAIVDMQTTNAEFAAATGQSVEDVDKQYGFEFGSEPLYPSVVCEAHKSNQFINAGVGHARYLPPRGRAHDWWLTLQYDASPWPYLTRPAYEAFVPVEAFEVNFYGIKFAVEEYEKREKERREKEAREARTAGSAHTAPVEVRR